MTNKNLSVVMPAYNEAHTISKVVKAVLAQPMVAELIIVDDCSTDGTREVLKSLAEHEPQIRYFEHGENLGKGAALRTGISKATADFVIIQDADLEYDPREYGKLLAPLF